MNTRTQLDASLTLVHTNADAGAGPAAIVSALHRAAQRASGWMSGSGVQDPRDTFLAASVDAEDYERRLAAWEHGEAQRRALPLAL